MWYSLKIFSYTQKKASLTGFGQAAFWLLLITFSAATAGAQIAAEDVPELFGVLTPEEHGYIYLNDETLLPLGHGYHVYRQHGDEEIRLTEEPVYPASSGAEFRRMVGSDFYEDIETALEDADSPQEVFFSIRGNAFDRGLLVYVFPQTALAMGILYIDEEPVTQEPVRYRFEWVNQRGQPTGVQREEVVVLEPAAFSAPELGEIRRLGREVSVQWEYPGHGINEEDEGVIRFEVYMRTENEENFEQVTTESRLRLEGQTEFEYRFPVDREIESAEFTVAAFDVTGENSMMADPVEVSLVDERQPEPIREVFSTVVDGMVELTWPVSSEAEVAGYHIKRINVQAEDTTYLNDELIDADDPRFTDRTLESGYHYHYFVIAESESGIRSEPGNPAIENIIAVHYPPTPAELTASVDEEEKVIELDWQNPEQDTLFNTYVVLRRPYSHEGESDEAFSQINEGRLTNTRLVDQGVAGEGFEEGRYYEYGVVAANRQGLRSDTVFVVKQMPILTPPEPPAMLQADLGSGNRAQLSWSASASTSVTSYNVYRVSETGDTTVTERPRGRRFLQDENIQTGLVYNYHATAVDSVGNESEPVHAEELHVRDQNPPPSVRNVQANETDDGVRVTWERSPARDLDGYVVKRATLSNGVYEEITDEITEDTELVDPDGEAGLWYRVLAVDESGNRSRPGSARQARD